MTTPRAILPILLATVALAACGSDDDKPTSPAKSTETTTTIAPGAEPARAAAACRNAAEEALTLLKSFRAESRGIVAPNTAEYKADARKIIRRAERAGCDVPQSVVDTLEAFLGTS